MFTPALDGMGLFTPALDGISLDCKASNDYWKSKVKRLKILSSSIADEELVCDGDNGAIELN